MWWEDRESITKEAILDFILKEVSHLSGKVKGERYFRHRIKAGAKAEGEERSRKSQGNGKRFGSAEAETEGKGRHGDH